MSEAHEKILNFLVEADKLKSVERRGYIGDLSRHDNPAEHTWHMMLMMILFDELSDENIDLHHALRMTIIHDIVEVYAGDTPVYDTAARAEKAAIEKQAAEKIFGLLPDAIGEKFKSWWYEFEAGETPEAKFANHCDYLQGFTQSYIANGKSWREMGVTRDKTLGKTAPISGQNDTLRDYIKVLYEAIDKKELLQK